MTQASNFVRWTCAKFKGNLKMLDYQLHYARMLAEDRLREATTRNQHLAAARIFRLRRPQPAARSGR